MPIEIPLRFILFAAGCIAGFVVGIPVSYSFFESRGAKELRKRIERDLFIEEEEESEGFIDNRREERTVPENLFVQVRSALVDDAGMLTGEKEEFYAEIVDIATTGIGIMSTAFLPIGKKVEIFCRQELMNFARIAFVRDLALYEKGIRIGFEFSEPVKNTWTLAKEDE